MFTYLILVPCFTFFSPCLLLSIFTLHYKLLIPQMLGIECLVVVVVVFQTADSNQPYFEFSIDSGGFA